MSAPLGAIVLAAGASRRLGRPKQLLVCQGETLLARAVRIALEAGVDPVVAVLGADYERVEPALSEDAIKPAPAKPGRVLAIFNSVWEQGISTSIHAGLRALESASPGIRGALILPCDQPRLTATHLRALAETLTAQLQPSIAASTYAGVLGIPAAFPRAVFPQLYALSGDKGARSLLAQPPCPLIAVPFAGGEIDIDRPADIDLLE